MDLLSWCISNARERAGIEHEWLVVGWNPTKAIRAYCHREGIRLKALRMEKMPDEPGPERTAVFLRNLYKGWNAGNDEAHTKWVARMGSDQAFSHDWLKNLMALPERYGDRAIYHCNTVESNVAIGSRHEVKEWGSTWDTFDFPRFDAYADELAYRMGSNPVTPGDMCDLWHSHPTLGRQRRPDGCSWLQTKALHDEFGPLSDKVEGGVTGDVAIFDKMYAAGVPGYLVHTATTYHLVRGESREVQA